jgi:formiminotetrahydrofolate cyclodeaminase
VEINLSYIKDDEFCNNTREQLKSIITESSEIRSKIYDKVKEAIGAKLG